MFRWIVAMAIASVAAPSALAARGYQPSEESELCLECHNEGGETLTFRDGKSISVDVSTRILAGSVHSDLDCSDCHAGLEADGHDSRSFKNKRDFKEKSAAACLECHEQDATPHARMVAGLERMVCTDCHAKASAHGIAAPDPDADCMGCHEHRLTLGFADGDTQALLIDPEKVAASVHGDLACNDCHTEFSAGEHPERSFANARELTHSMGDLCKECHFDKYTRGLEGIHYTMVKKGDLRAPGCVDCHGAHEVAAGVQEKINSGRRCKSCHGGVYATYAASVHGSALVDGKTTDVPVCSDCHHAHKIDDPRTAVFHNTTPQLCANCHADVELMAKYGLSANVLQSYLQDFHGVTLTFYEKEGETQREIAVCTDCHGVHDIATMKGQDADTVKATLLKRCQRCHPDATENFPDSWISHYEPDFSRAPLVSVVTWFYKLFIPFMVAGLLLQILLHLWRYTVRR